MFIHLSVSYSIVWTTFFLGFDAVPKHSDMPRYIYIYIICFLFFFWGGHQELVISFYVKRPMNQMGVQKSTAIPSNPNVPWNLRKYCNYKFQGLPLTV